MFQLLGLGIVVAATAQCNEGDCRDSTTVGATEICASQYWQEVQTNHTYYCFDNKITVADTEHSSALVSNSYNSSAAVVDSHSTVSGHLATTSATCQFCSVAEPLATTSPKAVSDGRPFSMVYYPNWSKYGRQFVPEDIKKPERFTHILYAFSNISTNGTVSPSDLDADLTRPCSRSALPMGCIQGVQGLRNTNSELRILLSIGGWTYSQAGQFAAMNNPANRENFARSAEYPQNKGEGEDFLSLLQVTRAKLNASKILTAAVSPNPSRYMNLEIKEMDGLLDYWLLIGYDYSGSFNKTAAHSANVYSSTRDPLATPFNTHEAVEAYTKAGVSPSKIILGMPLYGHNFLKQTDYKALATKLANTTQVDKDLIASWSYDQASRTLVSYDNLEVAALKGKYIIDQGLGGGMWWRSAVTGTPIVV
ncbi:Endochitinase 1 [Fulvia fulva]|nr:Endochitinase 1 [Fulvia fulva]